MSAAVLLALGVGGVAVVAGGKSGTPAPATALPKAIRPGAITVARPITASSIAVKPKAGKPLPKLLWPYAGLVGQGTGPGATSANPGRVAAQAATDKLKAEAKKAFESASAAAKCEMTDAVNKKYNLKLDCKSTPFEAIVTAATGAAGAAAGTALCGPPCSVVGGIVGTWAGKKIGPFAAAKWQDLEDWASGVYDDAAGWVGDQASDAYDYVAGWF